MLCEPKREIRETVQPSLCYTKRRERERTNTTKDKKGRKGGGDGTPTGTGRLAKPSMSELLLQLLLVLGADISPTNEGKPELGNLFPLLALPAFPAFLFVVFLARWDEIAARVHLSTILVIDIGISGCGGSSSIWSGFQLHRPPLAPPAVFLRRLVPPDAARELDIAPHGQVGHVVDLVHAGIVLDLEGEFSRVGFLGVRTAAGVFARVPFCGVDGVGGDGRIGGGIVEVVVDGGEIGKVLGVAEPRQGLRGVGWAWRRGFGWWERGDELRLFLPLRRLRFVDTDCV